MTTLKEKTDAKVAQGRKANPDFMKSVDELIAQAKSFQRGQVAIKIGQRAPSFKLPNHMGKEISSSELIKEGTLIIMFYRGSWCPYCNLQLRALNERINEISQLNAQLIAISPEVPDDSLTENQVSEMQFTVLSDQDASVASQYGVTWNVPEILLSHIKNDRKLDLNVINNGNDSVLPIPSIFITDRNNNVVWRHLDVDYRTRAEPNDIINALKTIN